MESLLSRIKSLVGTPIEITIKNTVVLSGTITKVNNDFIYFQDESMNMHYIRLAAINKIEKNAKKLGVIKVVEPEESHSNLRELLSTFTNQWLYVERTDYDYVQGILSDVFNDFIVFINEEKIIFVPISFIASVRTHEIEDTNTQEENNSDQDSDATESNNVVEESTEQFNEQETVQKVKVVKQNEKSNVENQSRVKKLENKNIENKKVEKNIDKKTKNETDVSSKENKKSNKKSIQMEKNKQTGKTPTNKEKSKQTSLSNVISLLCEQKAKSNETKSKKETNGSNKKQKSQAKKSSLLEKTSNAKSLFNI